MVGSETAIHALSAIVGSVFSVTLFILVTDAVEPIVFIADPVQDVQYSVEKAGHRNLTVTHNFVNAVVT